MARRTRKATTKRVTKSRKKAKKPRFKLNKKQLAQFEFLMSGGKLDEESE
jgi:hypothetical protein